MRWCSCPTSLQCASVSSRWHHANSNSNLPTRLPGTASRTWKQIRPWQGLQNDQRDKAQTNSWTIIHFWVNAERELTTHLLKRQNWSGVRVAVRSTPPAPPMKAREYILCFTAFYCELKVTWSVYAVTLETSGGGFSQREENVAHDGGASDTRGGDDVEDAIHILQQVLLRTDIEREVKEPSHTHTHTNCIAFSVYTALFHASYVNSHLKAHASASLTRTHTHTRKPHAGS